MKYIYLIPLILFSFTGVAQDILMQDGTFDRCAPDRVYDSGGEFGPYSSNENYTLTICAANPGDAVQLNFTAFSTQLNADILTIYDGNDTSAPIIGTYSGAAGPGVVEGSSASGCLTLSFVSNATGTTTGWAADIVCVTPCQTITASIDSTNPTANGVGQVEVDPGDNVEFVGSATFSSDGTGATYEWDFDDSSPITPGQSVSHAYANPGTYVVTLTVTDTNPGGCSDSVSITVVVLDNDTCAGALPICSGIQDVPSPVGNGQAEPGIDYSCLGSQPRPRWYFFQTGDTAGNLDFTLTQNTGQNGTGGGIDVDFIVWGPFDAPACGPANLNSSSEVDCSFSGDSVEFINIPNAPANSFYTLLVTNYSTSAGFINLELDSTSTATTNCDIICQANLGPDQSICNGSETTLTPDFTGGFNDFEWLLNGETIPDETGSTLTVSAAGTYTVIATGVDAIFGDPCVTEDEIIIDLISEDATFSLEPNCVGAIATITGDTGGVFTFNPAVTDGAVIDAATGEVTNGTSGTTYTVEYTTTGVCPVSTTQEFTVTDLDDASFSLTQTCDGATASINGDVGGVFSFNPLPGDGATIDAVTGTITGGMLGTVYSVEYATTGICAASSLETVSIIPADDPSFTMQANCEGATATITGDAGGIFTLNPVPIDGATIDADSGTISNGVSEATYTVEYTTTGPCVQTAQNTVTIFSAEDASFTYEPNCEGAVASITGTSGGTFAFEPSSPSAPAVLDVTTGNITNAASGVTYTVTYSTTGNCPETNTVAVTILPQDDSSFTIAPTCEGALVTVTGLSGGTFSFNPVPTDGATINATTGEVTGGAFDTEYTIEYTTSGDCPTTTLQAFTVFSQPTIFPPTPLEVCDDGMADGITQIDLSVKSAEVTGNNGAYTVSYHLTQSDAESGAAPLGIPYTNESNGQLVYVRVQDSATGCHATTELELAVQQAPVANAPSPLEYCDPDSDGFGVFDLTVRDAEITGGDPALEVTYHETVADAMSGANPVAAPGSYNNIVLNAQTLYARVESGTIATDCATTVALQLIVNPTPQLAGATGALSICDDASADGIGQFDLTLAQDDILSALADPSLYTLSYYLDQSEAQVPENAIGTPTNFTNTVAPGQTIWVRVQDIATGCYKLSSIDLVVDPLPVLSQPAPLELCDVNAPGDESEAFDLGAAQGGILGGQTGITLTYHESQADADAGTAAVSLPYTNTENAQTVFVRGTRNTTGCYSTVTLLLRVNPVPSPTAPSALGSCDADNDGFASFDLESRTDQIIGGELDVAVSYHETLEDAQMGDNALSSPYTNIVMGEQGIFVRLTNTVTGCYSTTETLSLVALPSPEVPTALLDYVVCDTNADGLAQFDLSTKDMEILGAQSPAADLDLVLTYHTTPMGAQTGSDPIANVSAFANTSNPQEIYVRLSSGSNGCVDTGSFEIRVDLPPEAVLPTPLELCDDEVADEATVFDLRARDSEITGGQGSWSVDYYETLAGAESQQGAVDAQAYTNTSVGGAPANPQTLYAVVTDTDTGCTDITTLTLRVLPRPTPTTVLPGLVLCDDTDTGDLEEAFDLTQNEILLLNGEDGVTPTYHVTQQGALSNTAAIVDPTAYENTQTPQTIYVRVTNDITGCFTIVDFTLRVDPLPEAVAVSDYILCELDSDGIAQFDLTTRDSEALGGQDPGGFTVSYHASQADADALVGALVSPFANATNPQTIYVAITNNATGCSVSTPSFGIEVQEGARANADQEAILYETCGEAMDTDADPTNDSAQFDLSTQDPEVLDGQGAMDYSVSYYVDQAGAELGEDPLPLLYENLVNPQVIWARVDNDTPAGDGTDSSVCYEVAALTLQVNPLPVFDLGESYTLCVDGNGTEVLGSPVLDTGLGSPEYAFAWTLDGAPIPGADQGSHTAAQSGTYTVTVSAVSATGATTCASTDSTEVVESAPPLVVATVVTQAFAGAHAIAVSAEGIGDYEYSLDGGPWQDGALFAGVSLGEHRVTVRDRNGCGTAGDTVMVVDYPTYFTPNGDGYNDTWNIVGIDGLESAKIFIFDRYGKLLKQISPGGAGWNGTYNGSQMPTSDYWFVVEYQGQDPQQTAQKEFKAHFTLKR